MDWRLIVLALWGGGTVAVYGRVLWNRSRSYRLHHDRRSRRDLMAAIALFLTAVFSGLSVAFFLFGDKVDGSTGFTGAVAAGALLAAGIVMATTERPEP